MISLKITELQIDRFFSLSLVKSFKKGDRAWALQKDLYFPLCSTTDIIAAERIQKVTALADGTWGALIRHKQGNRTPKLPAFSHTAQYNFLKFSFHKLISTFSLVVHLISTGQARGTEQLWGLLNEKRTVKVNYPVKKDSKIDGDCSFWY